VHNLKEELENEFLRLISDVWARGVEKKYEFIKIGVKGGRKLAREAYRAGTGKGGEEGRGVLSNSRNSKKRNISIKERQPTYRAGLKETEKKAREIGRTAIALIGRKARRV